MTHASVAVAAPVHGVFSYSIPEDLAERIQAGVLVEVPFGKGKRRGLIVEVSSQPLEMELKPIDIIVEDSPLIAPAMMRTLTWASNYYLTFPGEMMFAALPPQFKKPGKKASPRTVLIASCHPTIDEQEYTTLARRAPVQCKLIDLLRQDGPTEVAHLELLVPGARRALSALKTKGLIALENKAIDRKPDAGDLPEPAVIAQLTDEQQVAFDSVCSALDEKAYSAFLLHGVTGSGKTEVYLRAIAHCLKQDRGAIMLVPEIALTPQLLSRVSSRFGRQVAVLHSGLGLGERLDEWQRLRSGAARVAVGARSAVFAPVHPLGILVVDEEHDQSYKQSERLPYNGRDLAMVRAREEGAVVLLGTATPAVESYAHALSGRSQLLELKERVHKRDLPQIEIVDLRAEPDPLERNHVLGPRLAELLAETLDRREQAILFLNRRGYSSFALCKDCGEAVKCTNCSVALVHHLKENHLRCHYCGLAIGMPDKCASCGRGRMQLFGLGTEKCEEEVARRFPGARVLRLDSDTVSGRGRLQALMSRFAKGDADVLVGTQMVTKGHDVPGVTLVGVLLADLGIHLPDFRAAERTFQQLVQVAGRAGRGERAGRVVIQTFLPRHQSIALACDHDYHSFFSLERERRQQLDYPPASRLLMVRVSHSQKEIVADLARSVANVIRREGGSSIRLLGPVPSPLARLRGKYRWQMLVKAQSVSERQRVAQNTRSKVRVPAGAKILFDVDPMDML